MKVTRYQILHMLRIYALNNNLIVADYISTLYPCSHRSDTSSKYTLNHESQSSLEAKLNVFVASQKKPLALRVTLFGKDVAHVFIAYLNYNEHHYYYYDPITADDGLYSAGTPQELIKSIAARIIGYKSNGFGVGEATEFISFAL